jgi:DNA-binding transcriptional LysR family regulator
MGDICAVNFAAFDLNLLRVFDALMRERSVTRAGERVGLSQPAVSAALNRLRHSLSDQLFVRLGNEMVPTPRAEGIAEAVREALANIERAISSQDRFDPATARQTYSLRGADFFSMRLMPDLSEAIAAEAPGIRLRFLDSGHGDLAQLLQEGVIDVALDRPLEVPTWVSWTLLFPAPSLRNGRGRAVAD